MIKKSKTQENNITFKNKPNTKEDIDNILHPIVKRWFYSRFKEYSLPQLYGVIEVHSRNNVLISAETGSTKTLTAFLSVLNELIDSHEKGILKDKVYCLYISPLKALNNDIHRNLIEPLKEMEMMCGKKLGIRIRVRTGDTTAYQKQKMLKNPPHILITTPESLGLMLSSIKAKELLKDLEWVIIDEIHALAENKRGVHLSLSLERLSNVNKYFCRVGLSATIAPIKEIARFLVGIGRACKIIDISLNKKMDLHVESVVKDFINSSYNDISDALYKRIHHLIQEHKTTLVFTNTRSGTERVVHNLKNRWPSRYYEITEKPPHEWACLIGAHHGSLSKELRLKIEDRLKKGLLKAVVTSTSLELGIDIGYIDLVILLGSPKTVARALQRIGRSGHRLHDVTKGRILVVDRDDLVECSVLLKDAIEHKIDRIHIPKNSIDVLAQHIVGLTLEDVQDIDHLYHNIITKSYCFSNLGYNDYIELIKFLAGYYVDLEERHVYAKIWYNNGKIGKRRGTGMIYMMNSGTIPEQGGITVKTGNKKLGKLDEDFVERLRKGDTFILGGDVYEFSFIRGMTVHVKPALGKRPNVPRWISEMLPLSFDLAKDIRHLKQLIKEKLEKNLNKEKVIEFINKYLYVDKNASEAIYNYFSVQNDYLMIPSENDLLIEHYSNEEKYYYIFHAVFGRRVNDALSRLFAYFASKQINTKRSKSSKDVEIAISDHNFYIATEKPLSVKKIINDILACDVHDSLEKAIENTILLKRRFRHCAQRSFMILRSYKGKKRGLHRQERLGASLYKNILELDKNFIILKEAKREVLEDVMDIKHCEEIIRSIRDKKTRIIHKQTMIPSPFATELLLQGYSDLYSIEDKHDFLKRMHNMILAKIELKKKKRRV